MLSAKVCPTEVSVWFYALIRACPAQVIRSAGSTLVQGGDARFAPLLEWRQTLAANQPTYENSLGLFHPVCLVPITFLMLGVEAGSDSRFN